MTPDLCHVCGEEIAPARRTAMPKTVWCRDCAEARTERMGGNMVWHHKTAPVLELRPLSEAQAFHKRFDRRRPTASIGVQGYASAMDQAAGVSPFEEQ